MVGKLKPLDVERETKPGKYADGDGLYLIVTGPAAKSWSYRYWKDGKERWHGLGSFRAVSLKNARLARAAARLCVKGDRNTPGIDIVQERREARQEAKAAADRSPQLTTGLVDGVAKEASRRSSALPQSLGRTSRHRPAGFA